MLMQTLWVSNIPSVDHLSSGRFVLLTYYLYHIGRAFPAFEMSSLFIGANNINDLLPACLSSGDGTTLTLTSAKNSKSVDKVLRAVCITMGYKRYHSLRCELS